MGGKIGQRRCGQFWGFRQGRHGADQGAQHSARLLCKLGQIGNSQRGTSGMVHVHVMQIGWNDRRQVLSGDGHGGAW
jgi:hypothetical protein